MKYFLDTEFAETGGMAQPTIDLISIGLVSEDGREYYGESSDFLPSNCNQWVIENVLPHLGPVHGRKPRTTIRQEIEKFIGGDPFVQFYGYFADYDWVVFCWLWGCMVDLPGHFPKYCKDLKQMWDEYGKPDVKPPKPMQQHHSLADAKWNFEFYQALKGFGVVSPLRSSL